jgi:hypothetical protein
MLSGDIAPFRMALISAKNAMLITDPAAGADVFHFGMLSNKHFYASSVRTEGIRVVRLIKNTIFEDTRLCVHRSIWG